MVARIENVIQVKMAATRMYFLLYRSPTYPYTGAMTMKTILNSDAINPSLSLLHCSSKEQRSAEMLPRTAGTATISMLLSRLNRKNSRRLTFFRVDTEIKIPMFALRIFAN